MGVSNVSFGLKPAARRILNNVMLYHAVNAGLDAAIFNPLHIDNPEDYDKAVRSCAEDLLFNRNADALSRFVQYFENQATGRQLKERLLLICPQRADYVMRFSIAIKGICQE
jgi:5-methyltetrahydrofolate--homocysteine methyltransferase